MLVRKISLSLVGKWLPGLNLMIWWALRVGENGQGVVLISVSAVKEIFAG